MTSTVPGNGYAVRQGTSMAAPAVSGAVGLLVEDYRNRNNQTDPMPSTVRVLLVHSAEDLETGRAF
jgi:subtilisin family serine protease